MSYQINASYSEELHFRDTPSRQLYGILLKGIEAVGWTLGTVTENSITAYARFSLTSFGEIIHVRIHQNLATVTSTCLMPQIWSIGKNKRNIRRLGRNLNALMAYISEEELQQAYMKASAVYITRKNVEGAGQLGDPAAATGKISGFLSIFNPKPGYFITPLLIDLSIFYFLLIGLAGAGFFPYDLHGFAYLGANAADLTQTHGQWWRLLSYQFMHEGFIHLISNMFALLMIGVYLEPLLGRSRFLLFYLISGMAGGLLSIYVHPFTGSVGASASIFGMYGVFLAILTTDRIEKPARKAIFSTLLFFMALQLLAGLKATVDNSAHIGGLLTGFILGKATGPSIGMQKSWRNVKGLVALVLVTALALTVALQKMPDQVDRFHRHIDRIGREATMALRYEQMIDNQVPDDALIREIQYQSLGFWKQCAAELDQLDELNIGNTGHTRVQHMRNYVFMQVKKASFQLLWILHKRKANAYVDSIQTYNNELARMTADFYNTPWTFQ